jgi:hypothetical protein
MNIIGQSIPIYFTVNENDSVTVTVYEVTNYDGPSSKYKFNIIDNITIPITQTEYLLMCKPNTYYRIEFKGFDTKTVRLAYVMTKEPIKGFPLDMLIDFNIDKVLNVRYNRQTKIYEYLIY